MSSIFTDIDQESLLRFLRIPDPNRYITGYSFSEDTDFIITSTKISTETLKIIIGGISDHLKYGLGLIDIENIALFIIFIRFIVLAIRYNLKTSFYICLISLCAAFLWYMSIKDILVFYKNYLRFLKVTSLKNMYTDLLRSADPGKKSRLELAYINKIGNKLGPTSFYSLDRSNKQLRDPFDVFNLKFAFLQGSLRVENGIIYRADPISMFFARIPKRFRTSTDPFYYRLYMRSFPYFWKPIIRQVRFSLGTIAWMFVTRKRKRICPYFIRWHWTFILCWQSIQEVYHALAIRLGYYCMRVLKPQGKIEEFTMVLLLIKAIVLIEIMFTLYGLLHAIFSQYFYVPFLTENTEIHVGPRPKNSIYSGGYTEWQDYLETQLEYYARGESPPRLIPKIWHGWLGKDRKIPSRLKAFFGKLFKFLKKRIFGK